MKILFLIIVLASLLTTGRGCSLFIDASTISDAAGSNTQPVNLGFQFATRSAGLVTAIRYYTSDIRALSKNRTVQLYNSTGTLLAQNFSIVAAVGWQSVPIPPVYITPNNIYIASFFAPDGIFNYKSNVYNNNFSVANCDLISIPTGSGSNSLYLYVNSASFPTTSHSASFMVDVEFFLSTTIPSTTTSITPSPTPATPSPTPGTPSPTPATPSPTPATPVPTPAIPVPTPRPTPSPTPGTPSPTPGTPSPTPATPSPTPATPPATPATPRQP